MRDRPVFETEFPEWVVADIRPMMPFVYLVLGGVSNRPLMPGWSWDLWTAFEKLFPAEKWGMFTQVTLRRED